MKKTKFSKIIEGFIPIAFCPKVDDDGDCFDKRAFSNIQTVPTSGTTSVTKEMVKALEQSI